MSEQEMSQKIDDIKELLVKIENYIKVTDYEGYRRVNSLLESMDYSSLDYLRQKHNLKLRDQLNYDCRMMVRARMKDDFSEFCRYAALQIEWLMDEFMKKQNLISYDEKNRIRYEYKSENGKSVELTTVREKIEFCTKFINKENLSSTLIDIFTLRNQASHR
ncbi:MAG: hypothetical protein ACKO4S_09115 [Snowella sp.]